MSISSQTTATGTRTAEVIAAEVRGWTPNRHGWSELDAGNSLRLCTTDQTDRGCGWVFHVTIDCTYENGTVHQQGGFSTRQEAERAAEDWLRSFCNTALTVLAKKGGA